MGFERLSLYDHATCWLFLVSDIAELVKKRYLANWGLSRQQVCILKLISDLFP